MANKSLGTLTIDLVARVGGFVGGMDKAERASAKWSKRVQEDAKNTSVALAGIGAAAAAASVAAGVAGFNLLKSTSQQISSTDQWAKSLKISTQELLAWQFAAERAGVVGDNMADIFKDLSDKIGDAVLNKSGEAVDALNSLGLSAEKLSKISPDKQMLAIGEALGKISTNAGKVTILESLGNDLSRLLPLFDNNNEKLQKFIRIAKDYGVAPDPASIDDLVRVNDIFLDMEAQAKGLKMEIAGGLAKVDLSPLQSSLDDVRKVLTDPAVLQGVVELVSQVAQLAGWLVKAAAGAGRLATTSGNRMAALGGNIDMNNADQVSERINWLEKNQSSRSDGMYGSSQSFIGWIVGTDDSIKAVNAELDNLYQQRERLSKQGNIKISADVGPDSAASLLDFKLGEGESNGKSKPDSSALKLSSAFKAAEGSYLRQISLIDTTGKKTIQVTELQKLQFDLADGKLAGINNAQKERLTLLAKEVDRLEAVRKANEENFKLAEFVSGLQKENANDKQNLDIDIVGAYQGEETRTRLKEMLGIQRDYLDKQADLQKQLDGGDIDRDMYDRKTQALRDSLEQRLEIQRAHYKEVDELEQNGTAGFLSGLQTQIEASANLYENMQQVGGQAFSSLSDMIVEWAETGKLNVKDFSATFLQSMGAALLQYAAAQVAMSALNAFSNMIGIPYVGPAIAPAAATAAAASAGVLMVGVSSALSGQAHDGIDAVPETGTWLLQKGERVTTAQTSAKLDATLDRVASSSTGGNVYAPTINIPINGNPSDATVELVRRASAEAAEKGYRKAVESVATQKGHLHQAIQSKTRAGVKKR